MYSSSEGFHSSILKLKAHLFTLRSERKWTGPNRARDAEHILSFQYTPPCLQCEIKLELVILDRPLAINDKEST